MLMGAHAAPVVRPPPPTPRIIIFSTTRFNHRCHRHLNFLVLVILTILLLSSGAAPRVLSQQIAEGEKERDALLKFKSYLTNADTALSNWNVIDSNSPGSSSGPCSISSRSGGGGGGGHHSWTGVICYNGNVWGLQLENLNLSGEIDVDALAPLSQLRTLSFMYNNFEGPLPEFRKLGALKSLFLSYNRFSGDIPDDAFMGMSSLKKVYMSDNMFTGYIPTSLAYSPRLFELRLENNQFVGPIPDFPPGILKLLNVSNNLLQGPIPPSLKDMDLTSFSGNKELCGPPTGSICISSNGSSTPSPQPAPADLPSPLVPPDAAKKKSPFTIVAYVVCGVIGLALIAVLYMVYHRSSSNNNNKCSPLDRTTTITTATSEGYYKGEGKNKDNLSVPAPPNGATAGEAQSVMINSLQSTPELTRGHSRNKSNSSSTSSSSGAGDQHGKLSFVRDDRLRFDLQDLLRASAEVLGSGSFGSSYKAVLMDGQAVVVKRFKQMNNCGKEEFHEHMRRLGRLAHPNLLPLVAYYYRKEEKLLVFDFVHNGSLARHLHGNHSVDKPGLDWPTRLKIIKGVAKGLAYLYNELPSLIVPHGHLKSSNVLLNKSMEPQLMDYTLVPVVNLEQAQHFMVAYKAPEYSKQGRTTKKTDVWSLGILILETLTGKFPANYLAQGPGYGADLASWVSSILGDQDTDDVFDKEMGKTDKAQGEMHKLLKIAAGCCQVDLDKRMDLKEAVEKIDLLKERDDDSIED